MIKTANNENQTTFSIKKDSCELKDLICNGFSIKEVIKDAIQDTINETGDKTTTVNRMADNITNALMIKCGLKQGGE